jgi:hypothetical protein
MVQAATGIDGGDTSTGKEPAARGAEPEPIPVQCWPVGMGAAADTRRRQAFANPGCEGMAPRDARER